MNGKMEITPCNVACDRIHPIVKITLSILIAISGFIFICGTAQYIDIHLFVMTKCYPIEYSTEIKICYDGPFAENGPYPVRSYITFLFYNPTKNLNETIKYNLVCGNSVNEALSNAQQLYPYMKEITCGIKTWNYRPVTLFQNGYWDQKELMISGFVFSFVFIIMFIVIYVINCRRRYNSL